MPVAKVTSPETDRYIVYDLLLIEKFKKGFLRVFSELYSTLVCLPPLRLHLVGGCWDRTQDS
jgi:hypothetical protein